MSDQIIDQNSSGAEGIPQEMSQQAGQDPNAARESSIQRLKRQRQEAREAARLWEGRFNDMAQRVAHLEGSFQGNGGPKRQSGQDEYSLDDLKAYATNADKVAEAPHNAINASLMWTQRYVDSIKDEIAKAVSSEVMGKVAYNNQINEVKARVRDKYGPEALDPDSDFFSAADRKFKALVAENGGNVTPAIFRAAYDEAAEELGIIPRRLREQLDARLREGTEPGLGALADEGSQPTQPQMRYRKPQGPPPEDRVSGRTAGLADALAERKISLEKLKKGEQGADVDFLRNITSGWYKS